MSVATMTTKINQETNQEQDPVLFRCPCCAATLSVPVEQSGITGPCPHCSHLVRSPERVEQEGPGGEVAGNRFWSKLITFDKRLRWDADMKQWCRESRVRFDNARVWGDIAAHIDTRKTGWAIAAVFVLFMGTIAYRGGYESSAGQVQSATERSAVFSMPEGRTGAMGMEPAVRWMPSGGYVSDTRPVPEP